MYVAEDGLQVLILLPLPASHYTHSPPHPAASTSQGTLLILLLLQMKPKNGRVAHKVTLQHPLYRPPRHLGVASLESPHREL